MRVLKAAWPWLLKAFRVLGDALHLADIGGWAWDRAGGAVLHWAAAAVALVLGAAGAIIGLWMNAPTPVIAGVMLAFALVLAIIGARHPRRATPEEVEQHLVDGMLRYLDEESDSEVIG